MYISTPPCENLKKKKKKMRDVSMSVIGRIFVSRSHAIPQGYVPRSMLIICMLIVDVPTIITQIGE
jgi:hypothetical protein